MAHNIAHPEDLRAFEPVEYVWSDQYDWKIQIAGVPSRGFTEVAIGDLSAPRPRAAVCYADESDRLAGVAALDWPRGLVEARRLLAARSKAGEAIETAAYARRTAYPECRVIRASGD